LKPNIFDPLGKFQQTFSEDPAFGVTDYKGTEKLEGEEEAEGESSLVDLGRYKIKGMGTVEVEPFNLTEERSEGYFDDKGHFVHKRRNGTYRLLNSGLSRLISRDSQRTSGLG